MFEEEPIDDPSKRVLSPAQRALEKAEEFRMHAEIAAVFEGPRKFEARVTAHLDADTARGLQKNMMKLERLKEADVPVLPPQAAEEAAATLDRFSTLGLTSGDYHIYRRPGEVMMVRWLAGDEVDTFYTRLQAHWDAGLGAYRDEERQMHAWKQDKPTMDYLESLDKVEIDMPLWYLRPFIKLNKLFVLSTQTADEMNIAYLTEHVMGVGAEEVVGAASAPGEQPTQNDLAWFYKLFALRGMKDSVEQMCFFTYLQKTDESF